MDINNVNNNNNHHHVPLSKNMQIYRIYISICMSNCKYTFEYKVTLKSNFNSTISTSLTLSFHVIATIIFFFFVFYCYSFVLHAAAIFMRTIFFSFSSLFLFRIFHLTYSFFFWEDEREKNYTFEFVTCIIATYNNKFAKWKSIQVCIYCSV